MAEILENGFDSPRGRQAIKIINRVHGKFGIGNEEMLYVLSTFLFEPINWTKRYGWRPPTRHEQLASYFFWLEIGKRMAIRDIPGTIEAFAEFKRDYERDNFRFDPANRRVADATIDVILAWYPRFLHPLVRQVVYALLDEPLRCAFGYPKAAPLDKVDDRGRIAASGENHALPATPPPTVLADRAKASQLSRGISVGEVGTTLRQISDRRCAPPNTYSLRSCARNCASSAGVALTAFAIIKARQERLQIGAESSRHGAVEEYLLVVMWIRAAPALLVRLRSAWKIYQIDDNSQISRLISAADPMTPTP